MAEDSLGLVLWQCGYFFVDCLFEIVPYLLCYHFCGQYHELYICLKLTKVTRDCTAHTPARMKLIVASYYSNSMAVDSPPC